MGRVCRRRRGGRSVAAPRDAGSSRMVTAAPRAADRSARARSGSERRRSSRRRLVLARDGLGIAAFGDDADDTIAAVTAVLGEPDKDSGWVEPLSIGACAGDEARFVAWGSLYLYFSDESAFGRRRAALLRLLVRERERSRGDPRGSGHHRGDRPRHDRRVPAGGVSRRRRRGRRGRPVPVELLRRRQPQRPPHRRRDDDLVTVIIGGDPCGVGM